jgi:hypothetical protein
MTKLSELPTEHGLSRCSQSDFQFSTVNIEDAGQLGFEILGTENGYIIDVDMVSV